MVEAESVCLRRLGGNRSGEVRHGRFLANRKVTVQNLIDGWSVGTAQAVAGRHVLALQDTTELHFTTTPDRRRGLGPAGKGNAFGLMVHPVLVVDAESGVCHGLAGGMIWTRKGVAAVPHCKRAPEDRESIRWANAAQAAKKSLEKAASVTVVADREADIFSFWASVQAHGMNAIIRSNVDRATRDGGTLTACLGAQPEAGKRTLKLRERASKPPRSATLSLRFARVEIVNAEASANGLPKTVALYVIDVVEPNPPDGVAPLHWRLLTTHAVADAATAWQVVTWYSQRWHIEQLFRTMKQQGLRLEDSQIAEASRLAKLAAIATRAACVIMQLVLGREGQMPQDAATVFSSAERDVLNALVPSLEGKTEKQKNPHASGTLAWATWIIARLGGWSGYASYRPPGPITLRYGLEKFQAIAFGFALQHV